MIFNNQGSLIKKSNSISRDKLIDIYGVNSYEFTHKNKEEGQVYRENYCRCGRYSEENSDAPDRKRRRRVTAPRGAVAASGGAVEPDK